MSISNMEQLTELYRLSKYYIEDILRFIVDNNKQNWFVKSMVKINDYLLVVYQREKQTETQTD